MKLILTEDIPNLGNAGEVVKVKDGYGRNYLMPRGMAMLATDGRVKELEHKRRVIDERVRKAKKGHEAVALTIHKTPLSFTVQAGEEGKLFGSVTSSDIAAQLAEKGVEIDRRKIDLSEPIKQLGEYKVGIKLHREVIAEVKVSVVAAEGTPAAADSPEAPVEE